MDTSGSNQETSISHETVETNPVSSIGTNISHNILLGRWSLSLDLFGRVFMEDVGLEAGSVVSELGGFQVKEAKFRRNLLSCQPNTINFAKLRRFKKIRRVEVTERAAAMIDARKNEIMGRL